LCGDRLSSRRSCAGAVGPINVAEGARVRSVAVAAEVQRQWWRGGGDAAGAGPAIEEAGSAVSGQTGCGKPGGEGGAEGGPDVG